MSQSNDHLRDPLQIKPLCNEALFDNLTNIFDTDMRTY